MSVTGRVLSNVGGLYTVETEEGTRECRARGIFRKEKISPMAGDRVTLSVDAAGQGTITEILPRKNSFVRPPVANIDQLVIVMSLVQPLPNATVMDKMITIAEYKHVAPILVINKTDLGDPSPWAEIYGPLGYPLLTVSAKTGEGTECLRAYLCGKVSAFTGNSGVGKSSLLNRLDEALAIETGETSQKLGRGRHTTRASKLYSLGGGGYLVDTPGFSLVDMDRAEWIPAGQIPLCFREFKSYRGQCRYTGCRHIDERDCAVKTAVEQGHIHPSRYESYCRIRREVEKRPAWERKGAE